MQQLDIDNLWKAFNNKLKKEWSEKYTHFGSIDKIIQRTNLSKAIESDMYKTLNISRKEKLIIPNWNSINTYLKQGGFGENPKPKKLDVIAEYLGYKHLDDFRKEYKPENNEPIITQSSTVNEKDIEAKSGSQKWVIATILLGSVLSLFLYSYTKYYNILTDDNDKSQIMAIIEKGNILEFEIYSSIPNIKDTILLKEYFTNNGRARMNIIDVSKRGIQRGRVLDTKQSSRKLNMKDIKIVELTKKKAKVETIEHWKLIWIFKKNGKVDAEYDEVNKQTYHLKKVNNNWLIDENIFTGNVKIHPE